MRSPANIHVTQARTVLLATDNKNSVLVESAVGKANSIAYSAYGQQSARQEVATGLGFNGQMREAQIGWYLLGNGYRAYNPVLMRFHSPDRLSPFGAGGVNAYAYCGGSPVTRVDPSGAWWVSTLVQGIGTLLGGIFAGAAVNRVAHAVVHRLPQSLGARLGNVAGFYGGVSAVVVRPLGVPAAITQAVPRLMQGVSVVGNGVSQTLTGGGALALNRDMLQKTLNTARQTGQPLSRIAIETAKEVTGYNLIRGQPLGQVSHRAADVPLESVTVIASAVRTQGQNPT